LPEATPDFAKDLYIANAARSPEGDMVTLMSSADQKFKKYLTTREPVDGYSIAQIEWSEDVGKTKVTISKDGNFATLTFNQVLLTKQQGPPNTRSAAAPSRPAPLVPPSAPSQASRPRSQGVIRQDSEGDPASAPNLVPSPPPSLAAIAAPGLDPREGIVVPQPRLGQKQRWQQDDNALSESEHREMEEASRK
jgi:hypothetical protein